MVDLLDGFIVFLIVRFVEIVGFVFFGVWVIGVIVV